MKSFKGAMAQFYGEQRAQVKGIKERSLINKARNEAKKELEEAESDAPIHALRLDGRAARLFRNDAQFYALQQQEGLVPWGAHPDVMMDRYDVRALLDMYMEPDPRVWKHRQRSAREVELEEQLQFETYRDLIRLKCLGLSEKQGIRHAQQENVAVRAAARQAAVAAIEAAKGPKPLPSQSNAFAATGANSVPAGTGQFAAVGYSYGGGAAAGGEDEDDGYGDGPEEDEDDSDDEDVPMTAEDRDMDVLAARDFDVEDFSLMLRWAMREEAAEAAANRRRSKRTWSRKKARLRTKRIAGQGLDPTLYHKGPPPPQQGDDISWIPERKPDDLAQRFMRRDSPEYEGTGGEGRRSDRPQQEFITSFGGEQAAAGAGGGGPGPRVSRGQQESEVKDAVPGAADPALEGPAMLPAAAFKLHGVRADEARERERYGGSVTGRDYSRAKSSSAAVAPTVVRAVDRGKETPQERLKRLMAAQLNKKIQKDSLAAAQKQQQAEAERRARLANELAAQQAERRDSGEYLQPPRRRERDAGRDRGRQRSPSPDRYRHRSPSREHDRRRRSRSRSRSRDRQYRSSRRSPSPARYRSSSRR